MRKSIHFLGLLLAGILVIGTAFPAFAVDTGIEGNGKLEVSYLISEIPAADVGFSIYRVGDHINDFQFDWTYEYSVYQLTMDIDNAQELAQTLASYVARDNKEAYQTSKTQKDGTAIFENIPDGLYLIIGTMVSSGSYQYYPVPALVFLPYTGENGFPSRDVAVTVKYETTHHSSSSSTVSRKAIKVWEGDEEDTRPESIAVQLLRNGEISKEAVLNEENGWRIVWTDLSDRYEWTIVEKDVPDGYTSSVKRDSGTFIITNQKEETPEPVPTPTPTPEPTPGTTPTPEPAPTPELVSEPELTPTLESPNKLPQTSQNWTSVIVMAGVGIICLIVGTVLKKHKNTGSSSR